MPIVNLKISGQPWHLPGWAQALHNDAMLGLADDYDTWRDMGIFDVDKTLAEQYPQLKNVETVYITCEHSEFVEVWLVKRK